MPARLAVGVFLSLFLCPIGAVCGATSPNSPTAADIQQAIDRAKAYLYSHKNSQGTWEESPAPLAGKDAWEPTGGQWGGLTALTTYALLSTGDNPCDAKLAPAISFLKTADIRGNYALGLRAQVWSYLPRDESARQAIARDGRLLLSGLKAVGEARGMYGYLVSGMGQDPAHVYDQSVSQYGVLGVWALEEEGLEVGDQYWAAVDAAWRSHQLSSGAWSYYAQPRGGYPPTVTLTAAGVASLFLCDDYLRGRGGLECTDNLTDPDIDRGLTWIGANFDSIFDPPNRLCYALYGIERIGAASGRKTFAGKDWYAAGASALLDRQQASGAWNEGCGPVADTALALLFLVRGRASVIMNKLDYSAESAAPQAIPQSNRRPRDLAHLARWISGTTENNRALNWQVVNWSDPSQDWHDAPILYVCGRAALEFSDEQSNQLKQFIEEGGMVLFNGDCGSAAPFVESVFKLGRQLFNSDFRDLPPDHPIYTAEEFHRNQWKNAPQLLGLSNGARELMLLVPNADLSAAWQADTPLIRPEAFQLATNIFLYAVDKQHLRAKGDSYLVTPNPELRVTRTFNVARLDYGPAFDPEPGGWRRLAAVMHNQDAMDLNVSPVKLGAGSLLTGRYALAHLTGTEAFTLSPPQRDELSQYVAAGGTLVIDSAGGSRPFAQAARDELTQIFGSSASQIDTPLPIEHPFYSAGRDRIVGRDIAYRLFSRTALSDLRQPRLRAIEIGGRLAVYFSAEDLSVGLVGQEIDGVVGYTPSVATRLMEKIITSSVRQ